MSEACRGCGFLDHGMEEMSKTSAVASNDFDELPDRKGLPDCGKEPIEEGVMPQVERDRNSSPRHCNR